MSFLDIISCGFGAVVLFFVIINAQVRLRADADRIDLLSETTRLEDEVLEGRKDLLQIRGERDELEDRRARAVEELRRLSERLAALLAELAEYERADQAIRGHRFAPVPHGHADGRGAGADPSGRFRQHAGTHLHRRAAL